MSAIPRQLQQRLQTILPHARLTATAIAAGEMRLWLIDPEGMDTPLTEQQTDAAWEQPPYWSFCWGSGLAMARQLLSSPALVADKTVLDFGCGSGVVGIAAALAGAARVILCDIDPQARRASEHNLRLNQVHCEWRDDFFAVAEPVDVLLAADVLYDPENMPLLAAFRRRARSVLLADSRVKDFSEPGYQSLWSTRAVTVPDLGENEDVKTVHFYRADGVDCG